ncbi:hypothetical protein JL721_8153 [Aureococcus anophagefferens]|nr:hypothetical protein JL721_8153 [Aureococcus anophagefferens]
MMRRAVLLAFLASQAAARLAPQPSAARTVALRADGSNFKQAAVARGGASAKSSVPASTLNLAKNIVGSGVLALPAGVAAYSSARGASAPACLLIAALGAVSAYCFRLVGRACAATGTSTYRGAWEKTVGPGTGGLITGICSFKTLVGCVSYCIIIGDTGTALAKKLGAPALLARRDVLLSTVGAAVLFPLSMLRDLKSLAPTSMLGLAGMLYTALVVVLRGLDGSYAGDGKMLAALVAEGKPTPAFGTGSSPGGALLLVSMLATSFIAHYNAANFYVELENPTLARYGTVAGLGFSIAGFILNSFADADALANVAKSLVGVAVAFTYPLLFKGARDGLFELLGSSDDDKETMRTPVTAALVAVTVLAGVTIRDLGFVVARVSSASFGGAILGSAIIYILPTIIMLAADAKGVMALSPAEKLACRGVNLMGYVLAVLGGAASILARMGKL